MVRRILKGLKALSSGYAKTASNPNVQKAVKKVLLPVLGAETVNSGVRYASDNKYSSFGD